MTTKAEIRRACRETREALRRVERTLDANEHLTEIGREATGIAGEIEPLCIARDRELIGWNAWHELHGEPNYDPQ